VLVLLASGKLFYSFLLIQVLLGTVVPVVLLGLMQTFKSGPTIQVRRDIYLLCSQLILLGVLAMRWNVVVGGQLFSKSLRGFTTYKLELIGHEGLFMSIVLLILPFVILGILMVLFLPRKLPEKRLVVENP
jgi:predicted membrane protein